MPSYPLVPMDHLDANHPQYLCDINGLPPRTHFPHIHWLSKKALFFILGLLVILTAFTISLVAGITSGFGKPKKPAPMFLNASTITQVETIWSTTTMNTTTTQPIFLFPAPATLTLFTTLPSSSSSSSSPSPTPTPTTSSVTPKPTLHEGCEFKGSGGYTDMPSCQSGCKQWTVLSGNAKKIGQCQMDVYAHVQEGTWVCVVCPVVAEVHG